MSTWYLAATMSQVITLSDNGRAPRLRFPFVVIRIARSHPLLPFTSRSRPCSSRATRKPLRRLLQKSTSSHPSRSVAPLIRFALPSATSHFYGIICDEFCSYPKFNFNRLRSIALQVNELADLSWASGTTFVSKLSTALRYDHFCHPAGRRINSQAA